MRFEARFFLVSPLHPQTHATVCAIGYKVGGRCTNLFPKYWIEVHFLIGNGLYIYKGDNISQEDLYLKKQMIGFVKDPGYAMGCCSSG